MRRQKKETAAPGAPPWLLTFCDMMTLLLTFFVMLVSMSVIDERNKLVVLGSVSSSFGIGSAQLNPISPEDKITKSEPGAMSESNLEPIKNMLWEDTKNDLNFQENRFVQIVSINAEVLFKPGETELSDKGVELLNRMLPYLMRIRYPLLVAGHTANRRDEEGQKYAVDLDEAKVDSTWPLSLGRAQSVYRHFLANGIVSDRLSLEAFGQYHPRFPDRTPDGRLQNRRVDLVLDKRNAPEILEMESSKAQPPPVRNFLFRNFQFNLDGASGSGQSSPEAGGR